MLIAKGKMMVVVAELQIGCDRRYLLLAHVPLAHMGQATSVVVPNPPVETGLFVEHLGFVPAVIATQTGRVMHHLLVHHVRRRHQVRVADREETSGAAGCLHRQDFLDSGEKILVILVESMVLPVLERSRDERSQVNVPVVAWLEEVVDAIQLNILALLPVAPALGLAQCTRHGFKLRRRHTFQLEALIFSGAAQEADLFFQHRRDQCILEMVGDIPDQNFRNALKGFGETVTHASICEGCSTNRI